MGSHFHSSQHCNIRNKRSLSFIFYPFPPPPSLRTPPSVPFLPTTPPPPPTNLLSSLISFPKSYHCTVYRLTFHCIPSPRKAILPRCPPQRLLPCIPQHSDKLLYSRIKRALQFRTNSTLYNKTNSNNVMLLLLATEESKLNYIDEEINRNVNRKNDLGSKNG